VVIWIGDAGFVATLLIPARRKTQDVTTRLQLFEILEGWLGF